MGDGGGPPSVRDSTFLQSRRTQGLMGCGQSMLARAFGSMGLRTLSMKAGRQTTLGDRATVAGIGVHTGLPVTLTLHPAEAGTGVVFVRCSADGRPELEIRAHARSVSATELATVLGDGSGPGISTIEHNMATLCGLGVDNAIVELDGRGGPPEHGCGVEVEINFDPPWIGGQTLALDVEPASFRHEIARARTFGFMRDVGRLWSSGYALGASLENTLVRGEDRIFNRKGLPFADGFVRHKALDAIG